jgi:UDP-N-acetylglucosamine 1-carboxyvinyltransferase
MKDHVGTDAKSAAVHQAVAKETELERPVEKFVIKGGYRLNGAVSVSGAKNAALPIMAAFLLAPGRSVLTRVPNLRDIHTMSNLLETLGAKIVFEGGQLSIDASRLTSHEAPYNLVSRMRASFYVLGPLLARYGQARVSLPGGCAWGPRPVNLHLEGLRALGAELEVEHGYVVAKASRLVGTEFHFDISSVGATAQIMMAATLAEGRTVLSNAACEPDVVTLAECLQSMGAKIQGAGTRVIVIDGSPELRPATFENIPDRIEAGTFLILGAMAGGRVSVEGVRPDHLDATVDVVRRVGAKVSVERNRVLVEGAERLRATDVVTEIYPGYPTDLQAQVMACLAIAQGTSRISETIYHDRFSHVPELRRLGASIEMDGSVAIVAGVEKLQGAHVRSMDLRGSACLILAGLVAEGETHVTHVHHLDRGYARLEEKLCGIGARVYRAEDPDAEEA